MINFIDCEDLNKELGISFEINYNNLRSLSSFTQANKLPQGFFKQLIIHASPIQNLDDRISKELFGSSDVSYTICDVERTATVIRSCSNATTGFKYYNCFIFYDHDLNEIKKMFKYYKLKSFV